MTGYSVNPDSTFKNTDGAAIDTDAAIKGILEENDRRNAEIFRPYDPLAGDPADPGRVRFPVAGLECYIPEEMAREQLPLDLLRFGSLDRYLAKMKGTVNPQLREAVTAEWTRLRCRHDFPFWAAKFAYIKKKGGGDDILFVLNRAQRRLVALLEEMRREGRPIRLILLKARQWGGSTCLQLYMAWLQLVHEKGLNSLIIAHQGTASDEIKDMFDRMLRRYPGELLHDPGEEFSPKEKRIEKVGGAGTTFRLIQRNCKIKVGTAETPDACRGGDYNLIHLSEVGLWKATPRKMAEDVVRAATSGVMLAPMTMIVFESTANGTGNFFHREWQAAKKGASQFTPIFVAWHEVEQNRIPFRSPEERERFAASLFRGRASEQSPGLRRRPGRYLWRLWELGATLEGINWYCCECLKFGSHDQMASECPSDDVEAFVQTGANAFDKYKVEELRPACRPPLMVGEIDGDAVSGEKSLSNVRFVPSEGGALAVWADREFFPDSRVTDRYLVVVDIGGKSWKADWTVIAVFDRLRMGRGGKPEVVAQWRGHIDFDLLAWKAARIAKYYDNALLVIESNTLETHDPFRDGESEQSSYLLNRLRDAYPNLYARRQSEESIALGAPVKYGFHTNVSTKAAIISTLTQAIREGGYVERDEQCLSEYLSYERRQNGSYGAIPGEHDDILMTRAIGLHICFYEMEMPRLIARPGSPLSGASSDCGAYPFPSSAAVF